MGGQLQGAFADCLKQIFVFLSKSGFDCLICLIVGLMSHSQMLGKVESGGGPIFKVVLEC